MTTALCQASELSTVPNGYLYDLFSKLMLQPQNCKAVVEVALSILNNQRLEYSCESKQLCLQTPQIKKIIIDDLFAGMVKERLGLRILFAGKLSQDNTIIISEHLE